MADPNDSDSLETPAASSGHSSQGTSAGQSAIETDSLESSSGSVRPAPGQQTQGGGKPLTGPSAFKRFTRRFNIYLLLFILVLVISAAVILVLAYSSNTTKDPTVSSQSLPSSTLKQLASSDATVGDPKQVLNVQSNAIFAGKVLIRDSLDVAGEIHVSGSLTLPGITVSGDSTFDQVSINKTLNIGGDASVLGQLVVKKNLSVSGTGTFGGVVTAPQIATNQLQILGDLTMTSHLIAGGSSPGQSGGAALGSGGTASISGSDTSGTVNINVGNGPATACFITINFTKRYNNTPHVVISPVNSNAASLSYYVNRTSSGFSICTASQPASNSDYSFDYIVLG